MRLLFLKAVQSPTSNVTSLFDRKTEYDAFYKDDMDIILLQEY